MARQVDVYREWLSIKEPRRPLDYYQLLRVPRFCDDVARIRENYRKMNAHVRKFSAGDFAKQSQELLNELARAMLSLTDTTRKREYDAVLGRKQTADGRRGSIEEILLAGKVIDQAQLKKARDYADAVGLEIRDALVQQKMAAPAVIMQAYADSQGLSYVELADMEVAEDLIPKVPPAIGRTHSCVPLMVDEGKVLVATPHLLAPEVEDELRLRFAMPIRTVLCTAASINAVVDKYYPRDAAPTLPPGSNATAARPADGSLSQGPPLSQAGVPAALGFAATGLFATVGFMGFRGGFSAMASVDFLLIVLLAAGGAAAGFFASRKRAAP
ncbi:MAG: hypothetical protein U1E05_10955, partial [Patescibacteria group bacterium]|nr:hypothetical protein [Patescibacteria group bacterium]